MRGGSISALFDPTRFARTTPVPSVIDPSPIPDLPPASATVAVALSGGVDSAVTAALAVAAGYRVFGVMLRLWAEAGAEGENRCCTRESVDDARAVARTLDIPFQVLDAREVFKREVVDPYVAAAAALDTPNPCLLCNQAVRFGFLLRQVAALGADVVATGHYARVERDPDGRVRLLRGVDPRKDQSYVLHRLGQDQLARSWFPLGNRTKVEIRALAARRGLPGAARPDSEDLCWVGAGGVAGFLARHLAPGVAVPGPILDPDGQTIGRHDGLPFYTLGQRRGLGLSGGAARYVIGRDPARNALLVGPDERLQATEVMVRDLHWIAGAPPPVDAALTAQIRYRAAPAPAAVVDVGAGTARVRFEEPQRGPTPGQALVLYDGDVCLGGGLIAAPGGG